MGVVVNAKDTGSFYGERNVPFLHCEVVIQMYTISNIYETVHLK